jgi:hypothetical protein
VYSILAEKLNAELTRESALKAMNLIASNPNGVIKLTGIAGLEGQLITLMSNANRSVRLATLEVILTFL